jgi:hypothetical protein
MTKLPKRARLRAGTRLLNPFTGTYYKYGGRWVYAQAWTEEGKVIICMKMPVPKDIPQHWSSICFLVEPEQIGLAPIRQPEQLKLDMRCICAQRPCRCGSKE